VAKNPYALSKKLAEEACRFYAESFGMNVVVLRQFNVYGPGQADSFLIPSIIRQVRVGGEIRVKDLEPKRDYVYVADVVRAIVSAAHGPAGFVVCNVGSGVSHSVATIIETIQHVWGTALPVRSDAQRRAEEIMDTVADIAAAKRRLGWQPRFDLRQGLADMFAREKAAE
jgi:GDP-4-dehydro-6-deoxy-D-mannose reductase